MINYVDGSVEAMSLLLVGIILTGMGLAFFRKHSER